MNVTYSTTFPATESPLSESGAWTQHAVDCTPCQTGNAGGVQGAYATTQNSGANATYQPYDDSLAQLSGFPRSHRITGKVFNVGPGGVVEIELHVSRVDTNPLYTPPGVGGAFGQTQETGYEINTNQTGGYLNIGRFKGVLLTSTGSLFTPTTGDLFAVDFVYNLGGGYADLAVRWNGVNCLFYHDTSPPAAGNPAIGFFTNDDSQLAKYGYTAVWAQGLTGLLFYDNMNRADGTNDANYSWGGQYCNIASKMLVREPTYTAGLVYGYAAGIVEPDNVECAIIYGANVGDVDFGPAVCINKTEAALGTNSFTGLLADVYPPGGTFIVYDVVSNDFSITVCSGSVTFHAGKKYALRYNKTTGLVEALEDDLVICSGTVSAGRTGGAGPFMSMNDATSAAPMAVVEVINVSAVEPSSASRMLTMGVG